MDDRGRARRDRRGRAAAAAASDAQEARADQALDPERAYESLMIAIVMLASTKITIKTCIQIQNGDTP